MTQEFKEATRLWIDYEQVHQHSRNLFSEIQRRTLGSAVLIALGRGGWIPARIVAASFEEENIPVETFSIRPTYQDLGTESEHVIISQQLDPLSINAISNYLEQGFNLWIIDGPYLTGKTAAAAKAYLDEALDIGAPNNIHLGVLEYIEFASCPDAPWRKQADHPPDAFGYRTRMNNKPYIEYPWEYSSLESFKTN